MFKHDRGEGSEILNVREKQPDSFKLFVQPGEEEMLQIARTFQALADPTRSRIILLLTRYELCVNEISEATGTSASGVSHHLRGLRDIRLVKFRREGNQIYYTVDDEHVAALFQEAINHLEHVKLNLPDHRSRAVLRPAARVDLPV